jgi:hypothetical protein
MKDDLVVVADGGGIRPRTSWVHDWMPAVARFGTLGDV